MNRLIPFVLFALMLGVTVFAQPQVAPPPRSGGGPVPPCGPDDDEPPFPPGMGGKKGGPGGPGGPTETPRMMRLKPLSFDRRPSTILKAWAPKPKDDKSLSSP